MPKIIRLTESQLTTLVRKVLEKEEKNIVKEQVLSFGGDSPTPSHNNGNGGALTRGGTNTSSSGEYISPRGLQFSTQDDPYDPYDPYDPDHPGDPNVYPKSGSYESKLGRSPMCCKKCKNGKFKHQCDDNQKGGKLKYDGTNCVYETISDCQLNKRTVKRKKKSKK